MNRIYKTVEVEKFVRVDITDEVNEVVVERLKTAPQGSPAGYAHLDLDAAIVGILRLSRRGGVTAAGVLRTLVDLIGSDALRREIDGALGHGGGW